MAEPYDIGDKPHIEETFTDLTGVVTDPAAVSFDVINPDGTTATYMYPSAELTKVSTGVYAIDVPLTQYGQFGWKWNGTGAGSQGIFIVRPNVA